MDKNFLITGAILIVIGVTLGAFGAHALKKTLDAVQLDSFETGVRYQIYHGLAMMILGVMCMSNRFRESGINLAPIHLLMLIGVIVFSGSIYLLATRTLTGIDFTKIGFVTPIGGTVLIVSWILLIVKLYRLK